MHGVERDDAVCKIDFRKKLLRRRNLVGFLVDFDMRQHERRVGGESAQNLPRFGVVEGVETVLERLAVERQRKRYFAATREGMKRVTVVVAPDEHKKLKRLAVDADRSIEDLMREALGDLFAKHE